MDARQLSGILNGAGHFFRVIAKAHADHRRRALVTLAHHGAGRAPDRAVVRGRNWEAFPELIEAFRFHAPHIVRFSDAQGSLLARFPQPEKIALPITRIQPSQFYVDREKLAAVETFLSGWKDVIIQVLPWEDRYIALDGHTRLFWAARQGIEHVYAVISETDDWVWSFVREARTRGIFTPGDMKLLEHEEYEILWDRYCDAVFAGTVE